MPDTMDEVVNFNISYTGRAIHTLTTRGLTTKTYTHPTFSRNSILPTLLRLDKLKYKKPRVFHQLIPILLFHSSQQQLKRSLHCFYPYLLTTNMSHSTSPIYISSCSASPELAYPNAGNTLFPPSSPTPFANNVLIPPMNTHTSTPDSIPNYV